MRTSPRLQPSTGMAAPLLWLAWIEVPDQRQIGWRSLPVANG
ncbi:MULTISPECIES: hypothetical protein [unclassified Schlesneria]